MRTPRVDRRRTRRSTPGPMAVAAPVLACLLLAAGCASGGSGSGAEQTPPATSKADLDAFLASTDRDARSIGEAVLEEYRRSKALPRSADGLGSLSDGDRLGGYRAEPDSAQVCVEHAVDGTAVAYTSYLVNVAGGPADLRNTKLSSGTNTGCPS